MLMNFLNWIGNKKYRKLFPACMTLKRDEPAIEDFEIGDELLLGRADWTFTCGGTGKVFTWGNSDYGDIYRHHKTTGYSLVGEIRIPAFVGHQTVTNEYLGRSKKVDAVTRQDIAQRFLRTLRGSLREDVVDEYLKAIRCQSWADAIETADMPVRLKEDFWQ